MENIADAKCKVEWGVLQNLAWFSFSSPSAATGKNNTILCWLHYNTMTISGAATLCYHHIWYDNEWQFTAASLDTQIVVIVTYHMQYFLTWGIKLHWTDDLTWNWLRCSASMTPAGGASIQDQSSRRSWSQSSASVSRCVGSELRALFSLLSPCWISSAGLCCGLSWPCCVPLAWSSRSWQSQKVYKREGWGATAGQTLLWSWNSTVWLRPQFGV